MIGEEVRILDHGFVRLDDAMANDLKVVNSARVSFAKRSEWVETCSICKFIFTDDDTGCVCGNQWEDAKIRLKKLPEKDADLIGFLMEGRHGTPFEHNAFTFHVKAPIFVAREWMRHRIGSFNEWSLRYSKVENPDFYVPSEYRTQVGKPGAYSFKKWPGSTKMVNAALLRHYNDSLDLYNYMVSQDIAREQARLPLPFGMYTEFYWTVNARSMMNFLSLRNASAAQWEIRQFALIVEQMFAEEMPVTVEAFVNNKRTAP